MKLKIIISIVLAFSSFLGISQKIWIIEQDSSQRLPPSSLTREDDQIAEFLRRQYRPMEFERFGCTIGRNDQYFMFCDRTVKVFSEDTLSNIALFSGMLYPEMFTGARNSKCSSKKTEGTTAIKTSGELGVKDTLKILRFARAFIQSPDKGSRAYSLWLVRPGLLNPQVCILVVANTVAGPTMTDREFLATGKLIFFEPAWIVI